MSVIAAALRTAVVPRGGAFSSFQPFQLAAPVVTALLSKAGLPSQQVDQLIVANALGAGAIPRGWWHWKQGWIISLASVLIPSVREAWMR